MLNIFKKKKRIRKIKKKSRMAFLPMRTVLYELLYYLSYCIIWVTVLSELLYYLSYCTLWVTVLLQFLSCAVCVTELLDWDTLRSEFPSYSTELLYFLICCLSHIRFHLLYVLSYCIFWVTTSVTVLSELLSYWTELLYCLNYWSYCLSYFFSEFLIYCSELLSYYDEFLYCMSYWTGLSGCAYLLIQSSVRFTVWCSILIYSTVWVTAVLTELLDRIN